MPPARRCRSNGNVTGHLKAKGASVVARYFKAEADVLDGEGYFDTGDLASIDDAGNLSIEGRSKDLIKSGGEWINPAEIETIVGRLPGVGLVAVVGRPDPKWGERPILVIEPRKSHTIDDKALLDALRGNVADWWIPDRVIRVAHMPLAATGKIDKESSSRGIRWNLGGRGSIRPPSGTGFPANEGRVDEASKDETEEDHAQESTPNQGRAARRGRLEQILDAAELLFSRHGLYGVTLRDVALKVGVHTSLMHYYFEDKFALFKAGLRPGARMSPANGA